MALDRPTSNNGIVQTQWTINDTVFSSWDVLLKLVQAGAVDDVHAPALLAFEALGSSIIVCDDRIDEGMDALSEYSSIRKWAITLGLVPGGIPYFVHKEAQRCVPAFLLVTSLKCCCSDELIGQVLFTMLGLQGLARKPELRCSRQQLSNVVSSVSGFSDSVVPTDLFQWVLTILKQHNVGPAEMKLALAEPDPDVPAEIYSRVHGALSDRDVDCISLEGQLAFLSVATSLLWLHEGECLMYVENQPHRSPQNTKIILRWDRSAAFDRGRGITTLYQGQELSKFIITSDQETRARPIPGFVPASAAKNCIAVKYELSDTEIESVGVLATVMVILSLQDGNVTTLTFEPQPANKSTVMKLQDICQASYLSNALQCMEPYGWQRISDDEQRKRREQRINDLVSTIREWVIAGHPGYQEQRDKHPKELGESALDLIHWNLCAISTWHESLVDIVPMIDSPDVIEAATYMAGESLHSCICSFFPKNRQFRISDYRATGDNGRMVENLVFGLFGRHFGRPQPKYQIAAGIAVLVEELRSQCIESLIPGAALTPDRPGNRYLVLSANGYVGYAAQLLDISTNPRSSLEVKIRPGYLRWSGKFETQSIRLERLCPVEPPEDEKGRPTVPKSSGHSGLHPWDSVGKYQGLSFPRDEDELQIEYAWSVSNSGKILLMRTSLSHPASKSRLLVDWDNSIAEIARAKHLDADDLPMFAEEALAKELKREGVWPTVKLLGAFDQLQSAGGESLQRVIGRTHNNDELRFFLAGRLLHRRLLVQHSNAPLVKPIHIAMEQERMDGNTEKGWMIIA